MDMKEVRQWISQISADCEDDVDFQERLIEEVIKPMVEAGKQEERKTIIEKLSELFQKETPEAIVTGLNEYLTQLENLSK